jgi:hypothetical protein
VKRKRECPNCGREIGADDPRTWRPFCSERCRLIDLGDWIEGRHRIRADGSLASDSPDEPPVKH